MKFTHGILVVNTTYGTSLDMNNDHRTGKSNFVVFNVFLAFVTRPFSEKVHRWC